MKKLFSLFFAMVLALSVSAQLKFNQVLSADDFGDRSVIVNTKGDASFVENEGNHILLKGGDGINDLCNHYVDIALEGAPDELSFDVCYHSKGNTWWNDLSILGKVAVWVVCKLVGYDLTFDANGNSIPMVGNDPDSCPDDNIKATDPMFFLETSTDGITYAALPDSAGCYGYPHITSGTSYVSGVACNNFQGHTIKLPEDVRYIRLGYRATFQGDYRNIKVTPKNETSDMDLYVEGRAIDFGTLSKGADAETRELNVDWKNLKNLTATIEPLNGTPAGIFSVSPATFGKDVLTTGSQSITLTCNPTTAGDLFEAALVVRGEFNETDERVNRIVPIMCKVTDSQTISWYKRKTIDVLVDGAIDSLATASSGLPVSYRSLNTDVIAVINSQSGAPTFTIKKAGVAEIIASQGGGTTGSGRTKKTWDPAPEVHRTFIVHDAEEITPEDQVIEVYACAGEPVSIKDSTFNPTKDSAVLVRQHQSYGGDSIFRGLVHVNPVYLNETDEPIELAFGEDFIWNDVTKYSVTPDDNGEYTFNGKTVAGCDSIVKVQLTVQQKTDTLKTDTAMCFNQVCIWREKEFKGTGTYYDTVRYAAHPTYDSAIFVLNIVEWPEVRTDSVESTINLCYGGTAEWRDKIVSGTGEFKDTVLNVLGCDSIIISVNSVEWPEVRTDSVETTINLCYGDTAEWRDKIVSGTGEFKDTVLNVLGCDSIIISVNTVEWPDVRENPMSNAICQNAGYDWVINAEKTVYIPEQTVAGIFEFRDTIKNILGTDSLISILSLTVNPVYLNQVDEAVELCAGDPFNWNDVHIAAVTVDDTKEYTYYGQTVNGCDSIVTIALLVHPDYNIADAPVTLCEGEAFDWNEVHIAAVKPTDAKTYTRNGQSVYGCDSVSTIELTVNPIYDIEFADTICPAHLPYVWENTNYTESGDYTKTLSTINGCDSIVTLHLLVSKPNADLYMSHDELPASAKYNTWLLMINKNAIAADYDLNPTEAEVKWYKVVGEKDNYIDEAATHDDEFLGTGYAYTDDKSLQGEYYAIIDIPELESADGCGAIYRTVVLGGSNNAPVLLFPNRVKAGQLMTLTNMMQGSSVRIYDAAGQLMEEHMTEDASMFTIQAATATGVYMVKVHNDKQDTTLKYIVVE